MKFLKVGESSILSKNNIFTLSVKRLMGKTLPQRFFMENLKYQIKIEKIKSERKNLLLNQDNVDQVRKSLMNIFQKIKQSLRRRDGPAYIQVNLTFDGLKKVYIKSGIINIWDTHSHNIIYWLINQLDQVEQSSDNLVFSNNFVCDFLLIKTIHPKGSFIKKKYKSKMIKKYSIISHKMMNNLFFNETIKDGYVDMKLFFDDIFEDENINCFLVSVYFGILFHEQFCSFQNTIKWIKNNFISTKDFQERLKKSYKLFDLIYLKNKKVKFILDHVSKQIKKNILLFKKKSDGYLQMFYSMKTYNNKLPIKLFLEDNHCVFILENNNIEKRGYTFCDFCYKSFKNIKQHKCERKKCKSCFNYLNHMNEFKDEQICLSEIEKNIQFQCSHCNKIITNKECMLRHKMLSKTMCKIIKFCNQCKTNYSHKSIHISRGNSLVPQREPEP